ncbi:MAG: DDE-type integrase/transposase/recombinase [Polyangiaceae bacterium]|nr:DDE-type integrase/transposase/recombinase [Polyangiaceae bacterium]
MATRHEAEDPRMAVALCRYEVVGRYLALKPKRGSKRKLLEELAAEAWTGPDGEPLRVSAETLRVWTRRYLRGGLPGLMDKEHPRRGVGALTEEQRELVCALKEEVPERSLERVIRIAEELGRVERGVLRRSTVHRVLKSRGLSTRAARVPDRHDLDRFEADRANDLWQSDMLVGPWLPDPDRPGKVRRANLYAFLDDHSRLLLHGRFSFRESLPHLELVFRRALQKWGVPRRVYYDNGQVYRSGHMKRIAAELGIYRVVFTRPRRPEGHGKIEALNRYIRAAFLAELKAASIATLDALNEAFVAWADRDYNRRVHSETGAAPLDRWREGVERVRYADDEKLRQAFLWKETRTADKAGVFGLLGVRYQVGPRLARRQLEVRFDPEALHEVEVWSKGAFAERVKPLSVLAHRRPRDAEPAPKNAAAPVADYLGHLVEKRRADNRVEPSPKALTENARKERERSALAIADLLTDKLDAGVVDSAAVRDFVDRFGPFDPDLAEQTLDDLLRGGQRRDLHVSVYLDAVREAAKGGAL